MGCLRENWLVDWIRVHQEGSQPFLTYLWMLKSQPCVIMTCYLLISKPMLLDQPQSFFIGGSHLLSTTITPSFLTQKKNLLVLFRITSITETLYSLTSYHHGFKYQPLPFCNVLQIFRPLIHYNLLCNGLWWQQYIANSHIDIAAVTII